MNDWLSLWTILPWVIGIVCFFGVIKLVCDWLDMHWSDEQDPEEGDDGGAEELEERPFFDRSEFWGPPDDDQRLHSRDARLLLMPNRQEKRPPDLEWPFWGSIGENCPSRSFTIRYEDGSGPEIL